MYSVLLLDLHFIKDHVLVTMLELTERRCDHSALSCCFGSSSCLSSMSRAICGDHQLHAKRAAYRDLCSRHCISDSQLRSKDDD
jgi:hypothetical protein